MTIRVLLFAYEFPPVVAPQSLRWHYLASELARLGVEVDVLAPALRNMWQFETELHPAVRTVRCFPGPFVGLSGWLAGRRRNVGQGAAFEGEVATAEHRDLAERLYRGVRKVLDQVLVPDVRTEWLPFAWRHARRLRARRGYDLVISSHEPGVDLLLGLMAKRQWKLPWIVDLADPVVAPYTPRWRRRLDAVLERAACVRADAILVTTEGVKDLLVRRHDVDRARLALVRQGFDHREAHCLPGTGESVATDRFVLVFTGTFYRQFRDPSNLIAALNDLRQVHLVLAGDLGPYARKFGALGERVTVLGKRSHNDCLTLQRSATALVNLGNAQDFQIPGKIYEYFGARRPVLHIAGSQTDPVPNLLSRIRRGVGVANDPGSIKAVIGDWHDRWRRGELDRLFDLSDGAVEQYSWAASARKVHAIICDLTGR
jgi:glycosyltransferase involved in cell wall biosynthesis